MLNGVLKKSQFKIVEIFIPQIHLVRSKCMFSIYKVMPLEVYLYDIRNTRRLN